MLLPPCIEGEAVLLNVVIHGVVECRSHYCSGRVLVLEGKRKGIVWGSSSRVRLWRNLEKVNNSKYGYSTPSKWRTTELLEVIVNK